MLLENLPLYTTPERQAINGRGYNLILDYNLSAVTMEMESIYDEYKGGDILVGSLAIKIPSVLWIYLGEISDNLGIFFIDEISIGDCISILDGFNRVDKSIYVSEFLTILEDDGLSNEDKVSMILGHIVDIPTESIMLVIDRVRNGLVESIQRLMLVEEDFVEPDTNTDILDRVKKHLLNYDSPIIRELLDDGVKIGSPIMFLSETLIDVGDDILEELSVLLYSNLTLEDVKISISSSLEDKYSLSVYIQKRNKLFSEYIDILEVSE